MVPFAYCHVLHLVLPLAFVIKIPHTKTSTREPRSKYTCNQARSEWSKHKLNSFVRIQMVVVVGVALMSVY